MIFSGPESSIRIDKNVFSCSIKDSSNLFTSALFADEFSREMLSSVPFVDDDEQPIEPISDIGINKINKIMFESFK